MATKYLYGSDNADTVKVGTVNLDASDNYVIYTYAGDDYLQLFVDGSLWVDAGAGKDSIEIRGSGLATVYGGLGDDFIQHYQNTFDDGVARMYGGAGNDRITSYVSGTGEILDGGDGNDWLSLSEGNKAYGGAGDDTYNLYNVFDQYDEQSDVTIVEYAGGGYDTIEANFAEFRFFANIEAYKALYTRDVTIYGNDYANTVTLMGGHDKAWLGGGNDAIHTGSGNDKVWGEGGNDTITMADGDDWADGGAGDDVILGASFKYGYPAFEDGDNILYGGAGNDKLYGGTGTDYLSGGTGDDFMFADWSAWGDDTMVGGLGNDTYLTDGGDDIIENANEGLDTIEFIGQIFTLPEHVENLRAGVHPQGSLGQYAGSITVTGNLLANVISATGYGDTVYGLAGADTLSGLKGNDKLWGGDHDDRLNGDEGNDFLYGEAGYDRIYGGSGNDFAYGGTGNDELAGNDGDDFLIGETGNDTIYGGEGKDFANGGDGYDTLYGELGDDTLRGGENSDYLYGNDGADTLYGDGGSDYLWGGAAGDTFKFIKTKDSRIGDGIDQIKDFQQGLDRIDLSAIDASTLATGNQAFIWAGMAQPVAKAGTLWGQAMPGNAYTPAFVRVYGDVNGDGTADMSIDVIGHTSLSSADFVL